IGVTRGNGTAVTVQAGAQIGCPRHPRLAEQLAKHFQLRGIMSDAQREVLLLNLNAEESEVLRYAFPDLPIAYQGIVPIAGYPGVTANVTIYRNRERYEGPATDPCRPAGLLIKGARAIYENTLFG